MFLNLDQKPPQSLAAVDDSRVSVTYGDTVSFAGMFGNVLPERTLNTEKGLYESLRDLYRPEYLWIPSEMEADFGYASL